MSTGISPELRAKDLLARGMVDCEGNEVPLAEHLGDYYLLSALWGEKAEFSAEELLGMEPNALWGVITDRCKGLADAANISAIMAKPLGFNDHGWDNHIQPMFVDAMRLAEQFGLSRIELNKLLLALGPHDVGMLWSRKYHPWISPEVFERIFPEFTGTEELGEIKQIIFRHDEAVANRIIEGLGKFENEEDLYRAIRETFSKPELLLILLDKIQTIGRHRVTPAERDYEGNVMRDIHTLLCAFIEMPLKHFKLNRKSAVEGEEAGDEKKEKVKEQERITPYARERLLFRSDIQEYEAKALGHVSIEKKYGVVIGATEEMHQAHRRFGFPHMFWWLQEFIANYGSRVSLKANILFALDPELKAYVVDIINEQNAKDFEMGISIVIKRGEVYSLNNLVGRMSDKRETTYLNEDGTYSSKTSAVKKLDIRPKVWIELAKICDAVRMNNAQKMSLSPDPCLTFWCSARGGGLEKLKAIFRGKEKRTPK